MCINMCINIMMCINIYIYIYSKYINMYTANCINFGKYNNTVRKVYKGKSVTMNILIF